MGGSRLQLEFRWTSLLTALKIRPARPTYSTLDDQRLTVWCAEASKSLGLGELSRKIKVYWNPRMRTTAGRAWWPDRKIELNPKLNDCDPDEIWRTLKHELAHLVAYERNGRRRIDPHGIEWQVACEDLGIPGERPYHNLPFKRRKMKRKHAYVCSNCASAIKRVKPIKRPVACYDCCRKFNNGAYHDRFRLVQQKL
jgi:SprT protein